MKQLAGLIRIVCKEINKKIKDVVAPGQKGYPTDRRNVIAKGLNELFSKGVVIPDYQMAGSRVH